jgi:hypothetical protein
MTTSEFTRPVVFIGSSAEGLDIARALQVNLDFNAEVILWSQGVFGLSEGGLESLVEKADMFDYAILVLTSDDLIESREMTTQSPRDNVIFELGLFMGTLGRLRTFIVYDRTADLKLPSDLAGVTPATYAPPTAGTLQSALGAPSTQILSAIQARGKRADRSPLPEIDPHTQFRVIAGLLEPAAWQFFILMKESGATLRREDFGMLGVRYEYAIQSPVQHGSGQGGFGTNKLCERLADAGLLTVDLRGRVGLSERGRAFAEWLSESGYRAQYFWSDIGTWGDRPDDFFSGAQHARHSPRTIFDLPSPAPSDHAPATDNEEA